MDYQNRRKFAKRKARERKRGTQMIPSGRTDPQAGARTTSYLRPSDLRAGLNLNMLIGLLRQSRGER